MKTLTDRNGHAKALPTMRRAQVLQLIAERGAMTARQVAGEIGLRHEAVRHTLDACVDGEWLRKAEMVPSGARHGPPLAQSYALTGKPLESAEAVRTYARRPFAGAAGLGARPALEVAWRGVAA